MFKINKNARSNCGKIYKVRKAFLHYYLNAKVRLHYKNQIHSRIFHLCFAETTVKKVLEYDKRQ